MGKRRNYVKLAIQAVFFLGFLLGFRTLHIIVNLPLNNLDQTEDRQISRESTTIETQTRDISRESIAIQPKTRDVGQMSRPQEAGFPGIGNTNNDPAFLRPKAIRHYQKLASQSRRYLNESYIVGEDDPLVTVGEGWDVSPVVLETHKLIFFTTPKVGATVFKQLFRRMMGFENWPLDKDPNVPHNPEWNGLKYLYNFPADRIQEMLTAPDWTRAIFVRDPLERVLSAYLDKVTHQNGTYVKRHCCNIKPEEETKMSFQKYQQQQEELRMQRGSALLLAQSMQRGIPPSRRRLQESSQSMKALHAKVTVDNMNLAARRNPAPGIPRGMELPAACANLAESTKPVSFDVFVREFLPVCTDPHWKPQIRQMGGRVWDQINFVGHFDSLATDAKQLLQRIGAWEEFGAKDWPPRGGSIFGENAARHKTSAQDQLKQYYTPELKSEVLRLYTLDYEHPAMNLSNARWLP